VPPDPMVDRVAPAKPGADPAGGPTHAPNAPHAGVGLNAVANVAGQFVFVITGFVLPRLVNDRIGIERLGVWDFGWSIVAHLTLVGGGMMSAVSRDVARLSAVNDDDGLKRLVSSSLVMFTALGAVAAAAAGIVAWYVPTLLPDLSPETVGDARAVVVLLGLGVGVRFPFHVFNGIITGHQRYVLHNGIVSTCYLVSSVIMAAGVLGGLGVVFMALIHLLGEIAAGVMKVIYARRLCADWRIGTAYLDRETMAHVVSFGGRTLLDNVARVLLYQSNTLMVGYFLGVGPLAVYARCRSLVTALDRIVVKIAMVFTPQASALDARNDRAGLVAAVAQSTRYGLFVALPCVLFLVILGDRLLAVWMGDAFVAGTLLTLLAVGHLATFAQRGTYHVLMGMGVHGAPAVARMLTAIGGCGVAAVLLGWFEGGLVAAALGIVLPLLITDGLILPWLASRRLGVPVATLLVGGWLRPLLVCLPLGLLWVACRSLVVGPVATVALAATLGMLLYFGLSWRFLCSEGLRRTLRRRLASWINRRRGRTPPAPSCIPVGSEPKA